VSHHDTQTDLGHLTKIDVVDVRAAVEADKLTEAEAMDVSGPRLAVERLRLQVIRLFRTHVHETHDEIGYVLSGTGW
jgi:hypothetical protein